MKTLFYWFRKRGRLFKVLITLIALIGLAAPFQFKTTFAAGNSCKTSGPASAVYTLTVCITSPLDGTAVTGSKTVNASVTTTGTAPGVAKLIFYLDGTYLITDFESPFTFVLPTTKWVDGSRLLEVESVMRDGFVSQRASITLDFSNGIVQPPVNTKTFTPSTGTMPPAGRAFVLAATGDGADGATDASSVTDLIASWNPNLFLYLGDVYDDGTPTEFSNWYGPAGTLFGRFRSITNPVVGNHEYMSGGLAPGYFDYWDNIPKYYSYDAAGWHFIALDSNCGLLRGCGVGQAEYQWLQNDLNTHNNLCTIAYYHHPVFNVGEEGPAHGMSDIWALLAQHGVDIVLNGHDHDYQRWQPLDASGIVSPTGVTEFVAGGGGHGTQQFITSDSRMVVGFDTTPQAFGALRLQLNLQGAGYQYINTAGTLLDSGSVQCSGTPADTTAPGKPTNLSANASNAQLVQLAWTPSTDNVGVTGYSIYRDGSLLASIGPMTSYDDKTVQPGTTYSYQVRARDAVGNVSGLSSKVTVTTSLLLFSDGFESGDFSQWTNVSGLTIQQQEVYAGLYAARATSTGTPTYAYKQLSKTQNDLYYRLRFKILSQGANSVYLQRFRTGANGALLGVFVSSTGKLAYRNDVAGTTTTSTTTVTTGAWHELQVHILINGASGGTEVWLDGIRISGLSNTENLGTTAVGRIQLGENASGRSYDIALDRVALSTQFIDSAQPPEVTSPPTATPTPTATLTPAPTPTATPTVIPVSETIYDDTDPLWVYSSGWVAGTPSGPYNNTIHRTSTNGTTATFAFQAPAFFTFYYRMGPNRGSFEIRVDGALLKTVNAFSTTAIWQKTYTSPAYTDSNNHTVVIRNINPDGTLIDVDAMKITPAPAPAGPGVYDDIDPLWLYSPDWIAGTPGGALNGTIHRTSTNGSTATFVFQAPASFTFTYRQGPSRGTFTIWVDGTKLTTINAYDVTTVWQRTYTSQAYTDGNSHTVVIRNTSPDGTYVDVDAIEIN